MTVDEVQGSAAATLDQNEATSSISSADYSLRLKLMNRRERTWADITDWPVLLTDYNTLTSTNSGNLTVSLPANFRKLAGYPNITYDGTNSKQFAEINKINEGQYTSSDRYIYILGTPGNDAVMVGHPGTTSTFFASGASIFIPYYRSPASLSTSSNQITCPNPEYLVKGVIADVLESRDDPKFPLVKEEADRILANMIEREFTPTIASQDRAVKTIDQTVYNHRWGK